MHEALSALMDKKMIYTDFKPENILINNNNKKGSAFLTNLDSVVSLSNNKLDKICVITNEYFPPVEASSESDAKNKLISGFIKAEGSNAANRILSWQFCVSIFSIMCQEFDQKLNTFKDRSLFSKWKNENAPLTKYFKCGKSKISTSLMSMLDSCLYKKSKNNKNTLTFEKLIEHEWFEGSK